MNLRARATERHDVGSRCHAGKSIGDSGIGAIGIVIEGGVAATSGVFRANAGGYCGHVALDPNLAATLAFGRQIEAEEARPNTIYPGYSAEGARPTNQTQRVNAVERIAFNIAVGIESALQPDGVGLDVSADRGIEVPIVVVVSSQLDNGSTGVAQTELLPNHI